MAGKFEPDFLVRVNTALEGLSARERVDVLSVAWLFKASNARTEALITPGGFPEERERQVKVLRNMAVLVSTDEPDLEMERLFHEGDLEGMLRHLQSLRDGLDGEKGGRDRDSLKEEKMAIYTPEAKDEGNLIRFKLKDRAGKVVGEGTGSPGVSEAQQDVYEKTTDEGAKAWLLQMKYSDALLD